MLVLSMVLLALTVVAVVALAVAVTVAWHPAAAADLAS